MRPVAVTLELFGLAALNREWNYLRFEFAVGYASLCEIQKRLVHQFFDSRASFVRDVSHRSHYFLIKMIYPPPANTKDFNVLRPYFRECFHARRCELVAFGHQENSAGVRVGYRTGTNLWGACNVTGRSGTPRISRASARCRK